MRHSGVRIEELLELSQLSIRQYLRPNDERVALLVIAPSKSDRERVIPVSAELLHVLAEIMRRQQQTFGAIPIVRRYDPHERTWSHPQPFLFQRNDRGGVMSATSIRQMLVRRCRRLAQTHTAFQDVTFSPHDFRRLFATELVNNGLPIHIGARLLGHLDLQTTQGYVAVFEEDVVRHYQQALARRRTSRPSEEYHAPTSQEWRKFEEHFDKRKVELGACTRPYGTPCVHEHACIRCPMLQVAPEAGPRLEQIAQDLELRRQRAASEGWLGELEGIDLTLSHLLDKQNRLQRADNRDSVNLGMPRTRPT